MVYDFTCTREHAILICFVALPFLGRCNLSRFSNNPSTIVFVHSNFVSCFSNSFAGFCWRWFDHCWLLASFWCLIPCVGCVGRSVGLGDLINVDWPIPLVIKFYPIGQLGDSCQIGFKTKDLTKQDGVWAWHTNWDWTLSITLFSSLSFISMLNLAVVGSPIPYIRKLCACSYTPVETLVRGRVV